MPALAAGGILRRALAGGSGAAEAPRDSRPRTARGVPGCPPAAAVPPDSAPRPVTLRKSRTPEVRP